MERERWIRLIAGGLVVLGVGLSYLYGPAWLALVLFVGLNLAQSGVTGWCPMEAVLAWLGVPRAARAEGTGRRQQAGRGYR